MGLDDILMVLSIGIQLFNIFCHNISVMFMLLRVTDRSKAMLVLFLTMIIIIFRLSISL